MREIKFRVYHPDESKMYYFNNFSDIVNWQQGDGYRVENDINKNVKYMQHTGLKDKNGKEIYEGDIVEVETISYTDCSREEVESIWHHEGAMEFHQNGWCIVRKTDTGKSIKPLFFSNLKNEPDDPDTDIFEVVGNIYENPEMLGDV